MSRVPFTHKSLSGLNPKDRPYEVLDPALPGFGLRVLPTGKKVFFVRHRISGQRERLGLWGPLLSLEEARKKAKARLKSGTPTSVPDEVVQDDGSLLLRPGTALHTLVLRQLLGLSQEISRNHSSTTWPP